MAKQQPARGGYQKREGTQRQEPKTMTPEEFEHAFQAFVADLAKYKSQVIAVLPPTTSFQKFRAVIIMAIRRTPKLLEYTPTSLINACIHSAHDGLLPDGRLAVIVPTWNTQLRVNEASYRSMVAGVIHQMIVQGGTVTKVQPFVVYEGEEFDILGGSEASIFHRIEPDEAKRGAVRGVYAIATLKEGGSTYSYMTKAQVEEIRKLAQTDNVWKNHWEEMALKTVIRRLRKRIPGMQALPDMDAALTYPSIAGDRRAPALGEAPPRPTRGQFLEHSGGEAGAHMDFGSGWADQAAPVEAGGDQSSDNSGQQTAKPNNEQGQNGGDRPAETKPAPPRETTMEEWRDDLLKEIPTMSSVEEINERWEQEKDAIANASSEAARLVEDAFQDRLSDVVAGDTSGGAGAAAGQQDPAQGK